MTRQIWKFTMPQPGASKSQRIHLPAGARVLTVQLQEGRATAWVLVCTEHDDLEREWTVVGTGWELPEGFDWVATWQEPPFVWHLLERQT